VKKLRISNIKNEILNFRTAAISCMEDGNTVGHNAEILQQKKYAENRI
jgi:hypothetical protein